jgi:hypothetical protein
MSELSERTAARLADGEWFLGQDEVRGLVAEIGGLEAERDQIQRGGQELGGIVTYLTELINDAWKTGATDPIAALHMLGDHLAEALPEEGEVDGFNATYRALEEHRVKGAELKARVDDLRKQLEAESAAFYLLRDERDHLTGQVAERDETIQRVRDRHSPMKIYTECGHNDGECPDPIEVEEIGWTCQDGYMYSICRECCTENGQQTEVCATYHDHKNEPLCPTRRDVDGDQVDDGSTR